MFHESNKNVLVILLVSIGLITLPHFGHVPLPVFVFFYAVLSWRLLGIWKPDWLPGYFTTFVLTLLGLTLLYTQHQGVFGRDAGTNLFMIALALKFMEIKKERDIYLTTYLAFIIAASQFLYEQSLPMLAYVFTAAVPLLSVLIIINGHATKLRQAVKTALIIGMQSIPVAIVIFVLFPRVEAPRWRMLNDGNKHLSSLSDYLEPGSISDLSLSNELVFRVKFGMEVPPPHLRYWRGPVMSHTDGRRWTQEKADALKRNISEPSVSGKPYKYTLLMEPQAKNWVFALDIPTEYSLQLNRNSNYQLITSEDPEKRAEYKIRSFPQYNTGAISPDEYREAIQLPAEPSSRIRQLAERLHGFDAPPEVYIHQVMRHFRTENFRYTLKPPLMEADPIGTFLFETRSGFCSHYASAFVYLMRVAHIPSRVVTGFQGGAMNDVGHFLEIRQKDAHAWAEVWLENKGWVRFDPTAAVAPERLERNLDVDQLELGGEISFEGDDFEGSLAADWLKQAGLILGSADYNWQRWVINYNSMNQSRILSLFGIEDARGMVVSMAAIIAAILTVLGMFLLLHPAEPADKALRIYQKYCKKLAKLGWIRQTGEGAMDFAERVKA
ncbi:MAG: transglutaminase family protein, partial [Gammaproteobacteria bacterium]